MGWKGGRRGGRDVPKKREMMRLPVTVECSGAPGQSISIDSCVSRLVVGSETWIHFKYTSILHSYEHVCMYVGRYVCLG